MALSANGEKAASAAKLGFKEELEMGGSPPWGCLKRARMARKVAVKVETDNKHCSSNREKSEFYLSRVP